MAWPWPELLRRESHKIIANVLNQAGYKALNNREAVVVSLHRREPPITESGILQLVSDLDLNGNWARVTLVKGCLNLCL